MDLHDRNIAAIKEFLVLFGLLTFVGALVEGRMWAALPCLGVALYLYFERPIQRWLRRQFRGW